MEIKPTNVYKYLEYHITPQT